MFGEKATSQLCNYKLNIFVFVLVLHIFSIIIYYNKYLNINVIERTSVLNKNRNEQFSRFITDNNSNIFEKVQRDIFLHARGVTTSILKDLNKENISTALPITNRSNYDSSNFNILDSNITGDLTQDKLAYILSKYILQQPPLDDLTNANVELQIVKFFQNLDSNDVVINPSTTKENGVLILTTFHSGSTFVGNIFNSNNDVFYMFEPLLLTQIGVSWIRSRTRQNQLHYYLKQMLDCEFKETFEMSVINYPKEKHANKRKTWFKTCFRDRTKDLIYKDENLKDVARHLAKQCHEAFKIPVIKTIRVNLIVNILPLLASGVKVLYLVRDPRGLFNSRFKRRLDVINPGKIFDHMQMECLKNERNVNFLIQSRKSKLLRKLFLANFKVIRYEDVATSTISKAKEIYKFTELRYSEDVEYWIKHATSIDKDTPLDNFEKSTSIAQKWRKRFPFTYIRAAEKYCITSMNYLGFKTLRNKVDYTNYSNAILKNIHRDIVYV